MRYDFLEHFPKRMKHIGMYVVLIQNSIQKTTWKQYGFLKADEQINLIFTVMLYIMEQSLLSMSFYQTKGRLCILMGLILRAMPITLCISVMLQIRLSI